MGTGREKIVMEIAFTIPLDVIRWALGILSVGGMLWAFYDKAREWSNDAGTLIAD